MKDKNRMPHNASGSIDHSLTTSHVVEWSIDPVLSNRDGTPRTSCGSCRGDGDISLDDTSSSD